MQITLLLLLVWHLEAVYQPAQNFGLLTVTHSRNGDYSVIEKYLERYTTTECYTDFISEINIVWNNQQLPEDSSFWKNSYKWKIPVYFYKTKFNSMDHRYRLPKQSTAQLLYSLDDDIIVDCQTFKLTLDRYNQANKKQQLGRVTTNQVRAFGYDPNKGMEFFYQGHAGAIYFTIAEPGAAFIPRHYLNLYYLKLNELKYLHDIVLDVKNCDDIFFWAIVQHFYPELPAVYVKGQKNYKNTDPKVGQSKTKNVYVIRNKCINNISHALGYNSLRHYHKNSTRYLQNWQYPNLDLILQQKTAGLNQLLVEKAQEKITTTPQIKIPEPQKVIVPTPEIKPKAQAPNKPQASPVDSVPSPEKIPTKIQKTQPQSTPTNNKMAGPNNKVTETEPIPKMPSFPVPLEPTQQILSFNQKLAILSLIIIVLLVFLFKVYQRHRRTVSLYRTRLQDYDEEQMMNPTSIRLPDHY